MSYIHDNHAKDWAGLVNVETVSGTADDGEGQFRGFVTVRAVAEDGSFMSGQLSPDEVRQMALNFLSVAEAADQDALVFRVMVNRVKVPVETVAQVVMDMRKERG
jgi:glycine cleavage system aminomethyltransferase T